MAAEASPPVNLWFRRDSRLRDYSTLPAAIETARPILTIYILGQKGEGRRPRRRLSGWLDKSLQALAALKTLAARPDDEHTA